MIRFYKPNCPGTAHEALCMPVCYYLLLGMIISFPASAQITVSGKVTSTG